MNKIAFTIFLLLIFCHPGRSQSLIEFPEESNSYWQAVLLHPHFDFSHDVNLDQKFYNGNFMVQFGKRVSEKSFVELTFPFSLYEFSQTYAGFTHKSRETSLGNPRIAIILKSKHRHIFRLAITIPIMSPEKPEAFIYSFFSDFENMGLFFPKAVTFDVGPTFTIFKNEKFHLNGTVIAKVFFMNKNYYRDVMEYYGVEHIQAHFYPFENKTSFYSGIQGIVFLTQEAGNFADRSIFYLNSGIVFDASFGKPEIILNIPLDDTQELIKFVFGIRFTRNF